MTRPPSDAEILESLTPQQMTMYHWYIENLSSFQYVFDTRSIFAAKWSGPGEIEQWYEFYRKWIGRHSARLEYPVPPNEFVDMIRKTNFANEGSSAEFLFSMEMLNNPFLILGESEFGGVCTGFGLQPGPAYLCPNLDTMDEISTDRYLLGINTNVNVDYTSTPTDSRSSPKKRRQERSSGEDSTRSTTSEDFDVGNGFVFAQVGALYHFAGPNWKETEPNMVIKGPWKPTGFGVVVQVDERGRPGSVYIIFNFYEWDDESGDRKHTAVTDESGKVLPEIGRLHEKCTKTFTVAKIANSLKDLGPDKRFEITPLHSIECQIVRAKVWSVGQGRYLLRQFIRKDD
ncbi:hypothetical protein B0T26DRAFT_729057 [Lasiosphaeria miniovina]|uniref:Uncharacterized protein n=1 Tax=Lasiosphaeria miniovina TaxID=1954250 RepID=A0AA40A0M6_9PEZI|nr:uncharacterized protein B0T26DRAFT_729057 [Lasiosphaeria miniovina]KAK0707069.1 hypothetical protein B0T26DRAFT_729057 [Lasiosphaeria miniovina]